MLLIDTNIVLRYLLDDDPALASQAEDIIDNNSVTILTEVLCEVVYVMQKVYKINRNEIVEVLSDFLAYPNIDTVDNLSTIFEAMNLYENENIDFVDAVLAARVIKSGDVLHSFDKKLNRLIKRKIT